MNLEKAIEINADNIAHEYSAKRSDDGDALKLSNAALKRFALARSYGDKHCQGLLPGETED